MAACNWAEVSSKSWSLPTQGEMDLGRSLLGEGISKEAHSLPCVMGACTDLVCSGDLNSTRGPLSCFFLSSLIIWNLRNGLDG